MLNLFKYIFVTSTFAVNVCELTGPSLHEAMGKKYDISEHNGERVLGVKIADSKGGTSINYSLYKASLSNLNLIIIWRRENVELLINQ